jgi:hypothetical protein
VLPAGAKGPTEVNDAGIFIAGAVVFAVVFTGIFFYAMLSFGKWADRQ